MEKWVITVIILVVVAFILILGVLYTTGYLALPKTDIIITGTTP